MKQVVISHGFQVTPELTWGDPPGLLWYPALKETLTKKGYTVNIPLLPDTNHPRVGPWTDGLRRAVDGDPASTILVGHSVGGANVLRYLERREGEQPFAGAVLVSTNAFDVGYTDLAEFFATAFEYERIRKNVKQMVIIFAIDDPVLAPDALKHGLTFLKNLDARMIVLPSGGHFTPFDDCRALLETLQGTIEMLG